MDYSSIVDVVSFGAVVLALLSVFAAISLVYVALTGGEFLLDAIRGADGEQRQGLPAYVDDEMGLIVEAGFEKDMCRLAEEGFSDEEIAERLNAMVD